MLTLLYVFYLIFPQSVFALTNVENDSEYYVAKSMNAPAELPSYRIRLTGPFVVGEPITPPPSIDKWQIAYCINGYYTTTWYGMGKGYAIRSSIGNAVTAWHEKNYTNENKI